MSVALAEIRDKASRGNDGWSGRQKDQASYPCRMVLRRSPGSQAWAADPGAGANRSLIEVGLLVLALMASAVRGVHGLANGASYLYAGRRADEVVEAHD